VFVLGMGSPFPRTAVRGIKTVIVIHEGHWGLCGAGGERRFVQIHDLGARVAPKWAKRSLVQGKRNTGCIRNQSVWPGIRLVVV